MAGSWGGGRQKGLCAELLGVLAGLRWVYGPGDQEGVGGLRDIDISHPPLPHRNPKEVGDVIALSDITPSGAADNSQEPSPVGSRRGRVTPNLSRASSDADHGVSGGWGTERMLMAREGKGVVVSGRGTD